MSNIVCLPSELVIALFGVVVLLGFLLLGTRLR